MELFAANGFEIEEQSTSKREHESMQAKAKFNPKMVFKCPKANCETEMNK